MADAADDEERPAPTPPKVLSPETCHMPAASHRSAAASRSARRDAMPTLFRRQVIITDTAHARKRDARTPDIDDDD